MRATPTQLQLHYAHLARVERFWRAGMPRLDPPARTKPVVITPLYYCPVKYSRAWFDWWHYPRQRQPSVRAISIVVAAHFRIPLSLLLSQRRERPIPWARQLTYYLAKQMTGRSMPEIGRALANRDHTTVLHGVHRVNDALMHPTTAADTLALLRELRHEITDYCERNP